MTELSASLLGADLTRLGEEAERVRSSGARWIHIDNMDGHFVSNISFGPGFVRAIRRVSDLFLDVHLMFEHPLAYVDAFADAGADMISVHVEASDDIRETLEAIKRRGVKAGISLNPKTPVKAIEPFLPLCDMALVMTVEPGLGGQKLIDDCIEKVAQVRAMVEESGLDVRVEADGGIKLENAISVLRAGADVIVMGTGFFSAEDSREMVRTIMEEADACAR